MTDLEKILKKIKLNKLDIIPFDEALFIFEYDKNKGLIDKNRNIVAPIIYQLIEYRGDYIICFKKNIENVMGYEIHIYNNKCELLYESIDKDIFDVEKFDDHFIISKVLDYDKMIFDFYKQDFKNFFKNINEFLDNVYDHIDENEYEKIIKEILKGKKIKINKLKNLSEYGAIIINESLINDIKKLDFIPIEKLSDGIDMIGKVCSCYILVDNTSTDVICYPKYNEIIKIFIYLNTIYVKYFLLKNDILTPFKYEIITITNKVCIAKNNNLCGIISHDGDVLIDFNYKHISQINDNSKYCKTCETKKCGTCYKDMSFEFFYTNNLKNEIEKYEK